MSNSKKPRIIYRIRMNPETGEWEPYADGFRDANGNEFSELHMQAINRMEEMREMIIEEALNYTDYREANEVIEWVKKLDKNDKSR